MTGLHSEIPIETIGKQQITMSDMNNNITIKNSDGLRIIELSEDNKVISIKNTDPATTIKIDTIGEISIKGTKIEIIAGDVMINGVSLVTFMDIVTSTLGL